MAVAGYTIPELTLISACDVIGTWIEPGTWTYGGAPVAETDYFIQGTGCVSKTFGGVSPTLGGMIFDSGADQSLQSTEVFLIWVWHGAPNAMDTYANGGMRLLVGSASTAFKAWAVLGSDTYPYGGWKCIPVDPAITAEYTVGSPTAGVHQWFGMAAKSINAISKGNPLAVDISRYGRGTLQIINGDATAYGKFTDAATTDQNVSNRWGLCQLIDGTFVLQGHFLMGVAATAVDFRDSSRSIVIANTLKVQSTFNLFEIRNALSRVDWTNISIKALGTVSPGDFTVTDNADVNISSCTFDSMGAFTLLGATDILTSSFRSCKQIIAPGSKLNGTSVLTPVLTANTSAVVWNVAIDPDGYLNTMTFSIGSTLHHAIEFGTLSPTTMTIRGCAFSGFSASQNNNASIFHIKRTTGTVTINLISCSSDVSFATSYRTDGATVSIVQNPVTFSVTVKNLDTGAVIQNARAMVPVTSGANFPYQASVSISSSGTTATVTHATHGLATNDNILIAGADQDAYNGAYTITLDGVDPSNKYTYTMPDTAASPATGTITATMVLLNGLTNASGVITDSRTYSANQPVSGWVRKATGSPLYRQAPVADAVSNTNGLSVTVFLQPDE